MKFWFYQASWRRLNYHCFLRLYFVLRPDEELTPETSAFEIFLGGNSTFMNWLIKLNFIIFQISLVLLNCYSQKHPEFHEAWPQSLVSVNSSLQFPSAREHCLDLVCSPKHVLEHSLHELQALYWPSMDKKKIFDGGSRQFW